MAAGLTCARKLVEENGKQILLRKENKKKREKGVRTPLVPKEDKKGLNEPQTTIFLLVNESTAGMLEFRYIGNSALVPG